MSISTTRDFNWSKHALKRAKQRLDWEVVPACRVVLTEMRSGEGGHVWVGREFAMFVERGVVVTCINSKQARRGYVKSPCFDPSQEFDRLTTAPITPPPIEYRVTTKKWSDLHDSIIAKTQKPKKIGRLSKELGMTNDKLSVELVWLRSLGKIVKKQNKWMKV